MQAKSTVIKQIRSKLIEDHPYIENYIDEILPKKENVRIVKWWLFMRKNYFLFIIQIK